MSDFLTQKRTQQAKNFIETQIGVNPEFSAMIMNKLAHSTQNGKEPKRTMESATFYNE